MSFTETIKNYLKSVKQVTEASSVSIFINTDSKQGITGVLFNEGIPITEFKDISKATKAISKISTPYLEDEQQLFRLYPAQKKNTIIVEIKLILWQNFQNKQTSQLERRRSADTIIKTNSTESIWLGLHFESDKLLSRINQLENMTMINTVPKNQTEWLTQIIVYGANMVWDICQLSVSSLDPITQLPGRAEFQNNLKIAFESASLNQQPLGLMLINPDDFGVINQRFNQQQGDEALAEIALKLRESLRSSDFVFRYGGAIFGIILPHTSLSKCEEAANKLLQLLTGFYLNGSQQLDFSIGVSVYEVDNEKDGKLNEHDLLIEVDSAIKIAKQSGGAKVVVWEGIDSNETFDNLDRLQGLFTANTEKDYRNMLLLWDTITVITSGSEEIHEIANKFIERIKSTFRPDKVWLFKENNEGEPELIADSNNLSQLEGSNLEQLPAALTPEQQILYEQVKEQQQAECVQLLSASDNKDDPLISYAVPLLARKQYLGCLYLEGSEDILTLDSSDLIFLDALAGQVALVIDRTMLALRWKLETMRWKENKELESKLLREEVQELRQVFHSAKLIYRSTEMQTVIDTLQAVAATDVTVLINGESGTGKDILSRTLHEQSTRKDKPLVTVDCGAISHSLMEAELFGHVKGAYTGATTDSDGRIVQADGGTIFLDEIGEIPLDVQAKLLRFVQEKEISPVGASTSRQVNVRIIAATNRNLAKEVAEGKFREDLFYRLKVVTLTPPPLRNRPDDILPIARHFLHKFSIQYNKPIRRLTPEAEIYVQKYTWPGNVRELQNCILRAVVLSKEEKIDSEDIQLTSEDMTLQLTNREINNQPPLAVPTYQPDPTYQAESTSTVPAGVIDEILSPWAALDENLSNQVKIALKDNARAPVHLGQWLVEDLVLAANKAANGVSRRASHNLGVAETTYRRQLDKAKRSEQMGQLFRTPAWITITPIISMLVDSANLTDKQNLIERTRDILLSIVISHVGNHYAVGAALMGVTGPTFQRWIAKKEEPTVLS